jgi:hypothetical protein
MMSEIITFAEWWEQQPPNHCSEQDAWDFNGAQATTAERERFMPLIMMLWGSRAVTGVCPVCGATDDNLTGKLKCNEGCELNAIREANDSQEEQT